MSNKGETKVSRGDSRCISDDTSRTMAVNGSVAGAYGDSGVVAVNDSAAGAGSNCTATAVNGEVEGCS